MTMQGMVEYLEEHGFKAEKKYDSSRKLYMFRIERGDITIVRNFVYPTDCADSEKEVLQINFLEGMIRDYIDAKRNYKKENNMIPIVWKVKGVERWNGPDGLEITAKLEGHASPVTDTRDVKKLHRELQDRLTPDIPSMYPHVLIDTDMIAKYVKADGESTWESTKELLEKVNSYILTKRSGRYPWGRSIPEIKNVIFNDPATIVFWADGSKTVVKCQDGDIFNPETGLAMAITKKALGNKGRYCNEIKKWTEKYEAEQAAANITIPSLAEKMKALGALLRTSKNERTETKCRAAYHVLAPILLDRRMTKIEMAKAVEEAVGYLGEALDI